jgi:hypothetical protein
MEYFLAIGIHRVFDAGARIFSGPRILRWNASRCCEQRSGEITLFADARSMVPYLSNQTR